MSVPLLKVILKYLILNYGIAAMRIKMPVDIVTAISIWLILRKNLKLKKLMKNSIGE